MERKIKITLLEELLGTASADKELHEKFIAGKSADAEKIKEEVKSLPAEELIENAITVFSRNKEGKPILWDYQIRGFFKEALGAIVEFAPIKISVGKKSFSFSKWTYKRLVDNYIFVNPRQIVLEMPENNETGLCTRSLRADTMQGPRIALATSETVPAGTQCSFEVMVLVPELSSLIDDCLNYGKYKGFGQWRNSGKGKFDWEEL